MESVSLWLLLASFSVTASILALFPETFLTFKPSQSSPEPPLPWQQGGLAPTPTLPAMGSQCSFPHRLPTLAQAACSPRGPGKVRTGEDQRHLITTVCGGRDWDLPLTPAPSISVPPASVRQPQVNQGHIASGGVFCLQKISRM